MFSKKNITFLLYLISLSSIAQGRLWNRGTIQLDAGTEARVHGNILLDAPITGAGYLTFAGNTTAYADGLHLQVDHFRMQSSSPLILKSDFTITQQADFHSGVLDIQAHDLIFASTSPATGGNDSSFIQTSGSGQVHFPVDSNTASLPLGINTYFIHANFLQAAIADTFSVQLWPALTDNGLTSGIPLSSNVSSWALHILESIPGQNDIAISLQWPDASLTAGFFEPQSTLIFYNASQYIPLLLCATNLSTTNPNTLQVSGLQNVGLFGVGDSLYLPPQPHATITPLGNTTFCQGDSVLLQSSPAASYLWNTGQTTQQFYVSSSGLYQVTITDSNNCQSVSAPVNITVNLPNQVTIQQTACDAYTWNVNGNTYTVGGTYTAILQNQQGCDSVLTLLLTIDSSSVINQSFSICLGDSVTVGNHTYNSSGTYTDVLLALNGCDSTVITTITVIDCSGLLYELNPSFQVYPNPATDWISVSLSDLSSPLPLEIWSIQGQLLLQTTIHTQSASSSKIDVRNLPPGIYLLRTKTFVLPFIKL